MINGLKKVAVVAILLSVMLFVERFRAGGGASAETLAAIGFVVLAAYAVAELGRSLSLPQVTGYILAGVTLHARDIIKGEVVSDMRMFNMLALGFIATSAGLELNVAQIRRLGRTLAVTIVLKILISVVFVAGAMIGVELLLGSVGVKDSQLTALALVLGVLSLGTSPAIVLAVLSETKSKGRLSDLVLGAAVFKDLVVVVGLAIAIAIGRVLVQPSADLELSVLLHVGAELGKSIAAGTFIGLIYIAYMRFIRAEMLLFVAAVTLVGTDLCPRYHLEPLLVFIAAGFVVRNFSKYEHDLAHPLELVALPVFVVFFTSAGASIDLGTTWRILPLALALCGARALAYFAASRWGSRWGGESEEVTRSAWLAYLPQAGVTLTLVGAARAQLPELAEPITATGTAVVALNLLVGPITLRRALRNAGEIPEAQQEPEEEGAETQRLPPNAALGEPSSRREVDLSRLPGPARSAFESTERAIAVSLAGFAREVAPTLPPVPGLKSKPELEDFRKVVAKHRSAYLQLYTELSGVLGALPATLTLVGSADASRWPRWLVSVRPRVIPMRRVARIALEPALAEHVTDLFEAGLRRRVTRDTPSDKRTSIPPIDGELPPAVADKLVDFADLLAAAGTPRLYSASLRYSSVAPRVRQRLQTLAGENEEVLARAARAAWGARLVRHHTADTIEIVKRVIESQVQEPARAAVAKVPEAITTIRGWLAAAETDLFRHTESAEAPGEWRRDFDKVQKAAFAELSREFRGAAALRSTTSEIKAQVATLPTAVECLVLGEKQPLHLGKVRTVNLHDQGEALVRQLLPAVDTAVRAASSAVSQVPRRVSQAVKPEWVVFEAAADRSKREGLERLAKERFARADARVQLLSRITERAVGSALEQLNQALESACQGFEAAATPRETEVLPSRARLHSRLGLLQRMVRAGFRAVLERVAPTERPSDAASVRSQLLDVSSRQLPTNVLRWFGTAPVVDERVFVAYDQELEQVLDAESHWSDSSEAGVLIVAPTGAGKSSLLNMCELESRTGATLRLHASDFERTTPLMEALAGLLECEPEASVVRRQLALERPALFVDDLPRWVSAKADRHAELRLLLHLIAETRADAFWVVTIDESLLRLLTELEPVEEVFTRVVRLPPLRLEQVVELVESRLKYAKARVEFRPPRRAFWPEQLRLRGDRDGFYRWLLKASQGNPARVTALTLGALSLTDKTLVLRAGSVEDISDLDAKLSSNQLALLALLHRYGAQGLRRLSNELCMPLAQLQRHVAFLIAAGLVRREEDTALLTIRDNAQWAVVRALRSSRLIEGAS